jgi:flagellum-specific ATP synthase
VIDRAIAMHEALTGFLCQPGGQVITLDDSVAMLTQLLGASG